MSARARVFEFRVQLDEDWTAESDRGGTPIPHEAEAWTPEHLLLTGLARCSLTSFRYHARRAGHEPVATAAAHGVVTRRETDGRFAFVEIDVDIDVTLEPPPDTEAMRDLVARGERDCFVGASLTAKPRYRWSVNGEMVA